VTGSDTHHVRRTLLAAAAALLALAAAPAPAQALRTRYLWATVNICDTPRFPDKLGVRARMPGDGTRRQMFMRFSAQFRDDDGRWRTLRPRGTTAYFRAGTALRAWQEVGYTFDIDVPAGDRVRLRGVVRYQWRRGTRVVRRAREVTERGHPTRESDPRGYSTGTCLMEGEPTVDNPTPAAKRGLR
jgi:hypothetical protein